MDKEMETMAPIVFVECIKEEGGRQWCDGHAPLLSFPGDLVHSPFFSPPSQDGSEDNVDDVDECYEGETWY